MKIILLALFLGTSLLGKTEYNIKPENCKNWLDQSMYNTKELFDSKGSNDAQYQAGMLSVMLYKSCIQEQKFDAIIKELQMIKSRLQVANEQASEAPTSAPTTSSTSTFDANMGDYE